MSDDLGLVERLNGEAQRLSGHSIDRGSVDAGIASNLASEAAAAIERLIAENRALTEALTPSGDTKAEYAGEFTIAVERMVNDDEEADDDGDVDPYDHIAVPWTTIKQIMAAISARARQALGDT